MENWVRVFSALACSSALAVLPRVALANEPATAGTLQVGAGFRYGFLLDPYQDENPWGVGLGAEVGHTFSNALYVGGNVEYFFGGSYERFFGSVETSVGQLLAELGYDVAIAPVFLIRPKLGVGPALFSLEQCEIEVGCSDDVSGIKVAAAPGVKALLLTESFLLSLDVRYDILFVSESTLNGLVFSAGIGF
jgi:hypothetical protein